MRSGLARDGFFVASGRARVSVGSNASAAGQAAGVSPSRTGEA